jgi:hypothetical protein
MPQSDLPREVSRLPLSFSALIDVLGQIEDTPTIASIAPRAEHDGAPGSGPTMSVVGAIRAASNVLDDRVHEYLIGDPANLNGGHLRLTEGTFCDATLTTFDGNDFFVLHITLEGLDLLLQDESSGAP